MEPPQQHHSRDKTSSGSGTKISPWTDSSSCSEDEEVEGARRFWFLVEVEEVELLAVTVLLLSQPKGAFFTLLCTVPQCIQGSL